MAPASERVWSASAQTRKETLTGVRSEYSPTMNVPIVILIGALLGGLSGAGIFFEPKEPYKWQILCAATLKGVLIALLTGFSIAGTTRWWSAMIVGALYGFAFGLV